MTHTICSKFSHMFFRPTISNLALCRALHHSVLILKQCWCIITPNCCTAEMTWGRTLGSTRNWILRSSSVENKYSSIKSFKTGLSRENFSVKIASRLLSSLRPAHSKRKCLISSFCFRLKHSGNKQNPKVFLDQKRFNIKWK